MSASPTKALNVCLDFSPVHGGVIQAIRDFQAALGASVLSFDAGQDPRVDDPAVTYVDNPGKVAGKYHLRIAHRADVKATTIARDYNPGLLITHSLFRGQCGWTRRFSQRWGVPYWAVPHGSLDPWVFTYGALFKKVWLSLSGQPYLRNAAAVIFATRRERDKAAERYKGANTRVIHWPVKPFDLAQREAARANLRASLGLLPQARILLYLGRYDGMKKPVETIQAFVAAKCQHSTLVLVGNDSGMKKADLEQAAREAGAADSTRVAGPRFGAEQVEAFLGSDGFISLSHRENFGYTSAEALSAGLPVILSPGNDLAHELTELSCGWMLQSDDHDEAVRAIREFDAAESDALRDMGAKGREWATAHLSFDAFQQGLRDLQSATTGNAQAPDATSSPR